jgi:hypothetical protein
MSNQSDLAKSAAGFNGDPLSIDTANNRVGIGTTSIPAEARAMVSGGRFYVNSQDQYSVLLQNSGTSGGFIGTTAADTINFFSISGTERMRIDSAGRVTMPNQPAFFVSHQTITTGGIVNYQTVVTNIGNYWSTANSRFTAPVSGTYTFSAGALHDVNDSYIMFYKNGGVSHTQYGYIDQLEDQASITCVLTLSAGDYMQVWQNLDTEGNGHSWFCGYLIG